MSPPPQTNIVFFDVEDGPAFGRALLERDLLIISLDEGRYRAVLHLDVSREDVDDALGRIEEIVNSGVR